MARAVDVIRTLEAHAPMPVLGLQPADKGVVGKAPVGQQEHLQRGGSMVAACSNICR